MKSYHFTGTMRPHYPLSPKREIPAHIVKPDYADHRESSSPALARRRFGQWICSSRPAQGMSACEAVRERSVKVLNADEIEAMRKVCRVSCRSRCREARKAGRSAHAPVRPRSSRHCRLPHPTRHHDRRARPDMPRRVPEARLVPLAPQLCKVPKERVHQRQRGHLSRELCHPLSTCVSGSRYELTYRASPTSVPCKKATLSTSTFPSTTAASTAT
jgi:hypothetical protein